MLRIVFPFRVFDEKRRETHKVLLGTLWGIQYPNACVDFYTAKKCYIGYLPSIRKSDPHMRTILIGIFENLAPLLFILSNFIAAKEPVM